MLRHVVHIINTAPGAVSQQLECGHETHAKLFTVPLFDLVDCRECEFLKNGGTLTRKHYINRQVIVEMWDTRRNKPTRVVSQMLPEEQ